MITVPAILRNPRITLSGLQRSDISSGLLDPRLLAALAHIGEQHSVVITAIRWSRLTQPISGGDRRGQEEPIRAERSELRSRPLDADGRPSS